MKKETLEKFEKELAEMIFTLKYDNSFGPTRKARLASEKLAEGRDLLIEEAHDRDWTPVAEETK